MCDRQALVESLVACGVRTDISRVSAALAPIHVDSERIRLESGERRRVWVLAAERVRGVDTVALMDRIAQTSDARGSERMSVRERMLAIRNNGA